MRVYIWPSMNKLSRHHHVRERSDYAMSTQSSIQDITRCPSCDTVVRQHGEDNTGPMFCLRCRFPLMLVANKYRLLRVVSEGGFGVIYEAEHTRLTRDPKRAIKVIRPELVASEELQLRFAREVQVTSALSQMNGHIVRIYDDFGEIPNFGHFYVMEYLEGNSLAKMLKDAQGLLPLELCYHLFQQLCEAMHAAHTEGVIHRDLKPENLLVISRLRDSHYLKVIDFGIARPVEGSGEITNLTQGILGTPAYMSPEQCMSKGVDGRSDIYAMGIILFELLAGRTPFGPGANGTGGRGALMELITAHLMQEVPSLQKNLPPGREIPPALEAVVTKAIAKLPEARYANVLELEADFVRAVRGAEGSAYAGSLLSSYPSAEDNTSYPVLNYQGRPVQHTPPPVQILPVIEHGRTPTITPIPRESLPTGIELSHSPPRPEENKPAPAQSDTAPQTPYQPALPKIAQNQTAPRRSLLLGVVAFLVLAGAGGGGWWYWQQQGTSEPPQDNSSSQESDPVEPRRRRQHSLSQQKLRQPPIARRSEPRDRTVGSQLSDPVPTRVNPEPEENHPPVHPPVIRPRRRIQDDSVVRYIAPRRTKVPPVRSARPPHRQPIARMPVSPPSLCPQKPGYRWVYLSLAPRQDDKISFTFQHGKGIQEESGSGFCLGTSQRSTRVQIRGLRENYVPCTFTIWSQPARIRIKLVKEDAIAPESPSYCIE